MEGSFIKKQFLSHMGWRNEPLMRLFLKVEIHPPAIVLVHPIFSKKVFQAIIQQGNIIGFYSVDESTEEN